MREFKKKCLKIKEEYAADIARGTPDQEWRDQVEQYKPDRENWWCGCISYGKSAYHLCKHLIRIYIGEEGLVSNKPRMPFYGEVWRQTTPPILWVAGIHNIDRLLVRDLRANSGPPVLSDGVDRDSLNQLPAQPSKFAPEPPVYDPADEEEERETLGRSEKGNADGTDGEGGDGLSQGEGEESDDGDKDSDDSEWDFGNGDPDGEEFDEEGFDEEEWEDDGSWGLQCEQTEEESEYAKEYAEREYRGEQVQEAWDLLGRQMAMMQLVVEEIKSYPSTHHHLQEIPMASIDNFKACFDFAVRRKKLQNMNTMPTTFGRSRRGNVFM